jgi:hypothetical protein
VRPFHAALANLPTDIEEHYRGRALRDGQVLNPSNHKRSCEGLGSTIECPCPTCVACDEASLLSMSSSPCPLLSLTSPNPSPSLLAHFPFDLPQRTWTPLPPRSPFHAKAILLLPVWGPPPQHPLRQRPPSLVRAGLRLFPSPPEPMLFPP